MVVPTFYMRDELLTATIIH